MRIILFRLSHCVLITTIMDLDLLKSSLVKTSLVKTSYVRNLNTVVMKHAALNSWTCGGLQASGGAAHGREDMQERHVQYHQPVRELLLLS